MFIRFHWSSPFMSFHVLSLVGARHPLTLHPFTCLHIFIQLSIWAQRGQWSCPTHLRLEGWMMQLKIRCEILWNYVICEHAALIFWGPSCICRPLELDRHECEKQWKTTLTYPYGTCETTLASFRKKSSLSPISWLGVSKLANRASALEHFPGKNWPNWHYHDFHSWLPVQAAACLNEALR